MPEAVSEASELHLGGGAADAGDLIQAIDGGSIGAPSPRPVAGDGGAAVVTPWAAGIATISSSIGW